MLDKLYEQYGKLMIQAEVIQGKLSETKRQIAEEMNKPPAKKVEPEKKAQ